MNDWDDPDVDSGEESESQKAAAGQQRIADVLRAQSKLASLKTFRINNDKMYRDKELQEIRRKEIQQPLEEAHTTIEILEGKVARRDMMIRKLQKYISVDLLKGQQQSMDDIRARVVEINQTDEQNQIVLMDTITELQKVIETQSVRIAQSQGVIQHQWEKIKAFAREFEMVEFNLKEVVRQAENEKKAFDQLSEAKENKLQDLMQIRQNLEEKVAGLEKEAKEAVQKVQDAESRVETMEEAARQAEAEHDELKAKHSETETTLAETKEQLTELEERHGNLRFRSGSLA